MPTLISLALITLTTVAHAADAPLWPSSLYLDGGGWWTQRQPIDVRNDGDAETNGVLVEVPIGEADGSLALAGVPISQVRVCDDLGRELLYDVLDAVGASRRSGPCAAGDRLNFAADCPAKGTARFWVYFGNPRAWAVPDFLTAGLTNGGAESGDDTPAGWQPAEADSLHQVSWVDEAPRSGTRCLKTTVEPGAEPSWVKWQQTDIPVTPGRTYRIEAWVKAQDVVGAAGWFVHVNGDKPQLINQVLDAGAGTYDWRKLEISFTVPPDGKTATIGTVLRGTGTAWFDDVSLAGADGGAGLVAICGPVEDRGLADVPLPADWALPEGRWPFRCAVRALNDADTAQANVLLRVGLSRQLVRLRGRAGATLQPVAADGRPLPFARLGSSALVVTDLPPRTASRVAMYLGGDGAKAASEQGPDALVSSPANLVANASFEQGDPPSGWTVSSEGAGGAKLCEPSVDTPGRLGERCAKLVIPPDAPLAWAGWHQRVPVKPSTSYVYMGYLKCRDLDGSVTLYAHILDSEGRPVSGTSNVGAGTALSGTRDWTLTSGQFTTGPDAAIVELHLTVNAHGTVWHDGILLAEVVDGTAESLEAARSEDGQTGLAVWQVDPVTKVFPDEIPGPRPRRVELTAARGEREACQLVLRSDTEVERARVSATPPARDGHHLPAPRIERVGFVPIDYPSGYYASRLPAYFRLCPQGAPGSDGWAGEWPDPLIPDGSFALQPGRAQPVWVTVEVPADAEPGEYRCEITIETGEQMVRIPLRIDVLRLTLPRETSIRAIYDLRSGTGQNIHDGRPMKESLRDWYRFMAERRVCPDSIVPEPVFTYADGKVTMDATEFDEMATLCFDELGMKHMYTPWLFYALGWAYPPKAIFGLEPFTPEYEAAFKQAYRLLSDHLRERGWLDRLVYYISDEPFMDGDNDVAANLQKIAALAHEADPAVPIYSSTWRFSQRLVGALDIWGTGPQGTFPVDEMARRRAAGETLWFTTDGQMCIDTPYCAIERLLPYFCFRYDHAAYEFWGVSWWTYNPWERGWHQYIRQSDEGKEYYYIRYPNGDGYLTYPGDAVGVKGPVSSIRLEQAREGMEDYEALRILQQRVDEARAAGRKTADADAALAAARALVSIPNNGGRFSSELLPDPEAVSRIRERVLRAADRLERANAE